MMYVMVGVIGCNRCHSCEYQYHSKWGQRRHSIAINVWWMSEWVAGWLTAGLQTQKSQKNATIAFFVVMIAWGQNYVSCWTNDDYGWMQQSKCYVSRTTYFWLVGWCIVVLVAHIQRGRRIVSQDCYFFLLLRLCYFSLPSTCSGWTWLQRLWTANRQWQTDKKKHPTDKEFYNYKFYSNGICYKIKARRGCHFAPWERFHHEMEGEEKKNKKQSKICIFAGNLTKITLGQDKLFPIFGFGNGFT